MIILVSLLLVLALGAVTLIALSIWVYMESKRVERLRNKDE